MRMLNLAQDFVSFAKTGGWTMISCTWRSKYDVIYVQAGMPTRTMTSGARLGSCAVAGSRSERESDVSERGSNVGRLKATGF